MVFCWQNLFDRSTKFRMALISVAIISDKLLCSFPTDHFSFYYFLDSDRVDFQYFPPLRVVRTASIVVVKIMTHSVPFSQCPVKSSMRVLTSDFLTLSNVLVRFELWHCHVCLIWVQLGGFFYLEQSTSNYRHPNRVLFSKDFEGCPFAS